MSNRSIRDNILEKLSTLFEKLEFIWQTIQTMDSETQVKKSDRDGEKLLAKFNSLCRETQALQEENPITDAEIKAEIDAYRRGE